MTRALPALAVLTFFAVIGSITIGGGYSSSRSGTNQDPRSVAIELVWLERSDPTSQAQQLPPAANNPAEAQAIQLAMQRNPNLTGPMFDILEQRAEQLRGQEGVSVRTPSLLIQHNESAAVTTERGADNVTLTIQPSVLKNNTVQLSLEIRSESGADSFSLETAFTLGSGGAIVLQDLRGAGPNQADTMLAVRTRVIEPPEAR